ncbi:MAG: hypothetical protein WCP46_07015 [Alphaproteobacteria bacterium]
MQIKRFIKTLIVSIVLAVPILAMDPGQSGSSLAAEILAAAPMENPKPVVYTPSKEELAEIETLQKDSSIIWQLASKDIG